MHYDPKLDIVASDASLYGNQACIVHKLKDVPLKPIAHESRTLLPAVKGYSQIEKEALVIIFAVMKLHRYIHKRHFKLQTNHRPLLTKFGSKKGLSTHTANRLKRWVTILFNYDYSMVFLQSNKICHADSLLRLIPKCMEALEDTVNTTIRIDVDVKSMLCNTVRDLPVTIKEMIDKAADEDFTKEVKEKLKKRGSVA